MAATRTAAPRLKQRYEDEIKTQLTRLATELGPRGGVSETSLGRFIDTTAAAMDGNGEKLRETIAQLSGVGRILGEGSGDIVEILTHLQTFVTALRDSNVQIVQFQDRLADVTQVVDGTKGIHAMLPKAIFKQ